MPTLSNLFGWEYDSRLLAGRDVFSDREALVLWNDYTWFTEEGRYNSDEDRFYPAEGHTVDQAYLDRIHADVANRITYSLQVRNTDFYGVLFGPD